MRLFVTLLLTLTCFSLPALASGEKQCAKQKEAVVKAYEQAMDTMHRDMMVGYTGDTDIDFVTGMIPHHQGAVDMARVVLEHGKDKKIRKLAEWILTTQEAEIGFMKTWLRGRVSAYRAPDAETKCSVVAFKKTMETMHHGMMIPYTGDADMDFVRGMIPHHQGAIDMAWVQKKHGKQRELNKLADEIIRSQQQEIVLMQAWLAKQPAPALHSKPETKKKKHKKHAKKTQKPQPQKEQHHHDHHASH